MKERTMPTDDQELESIPEVESERSASSKKDWVGLPTMR